MIWVGEFFSYLLNLSVSTLCLHVCHYMSETGALSCGASGFCIGAYIICILRVFHIAVRLMITVCMPRLNIMRLIK